MFKRQLEQSHLLSAAIKLLRPSVSACKIDLFGKGITTIDALAQVMHLPIPQSQIHNIIQLNLSHNAISSLDNIEQFPNLSILNLSHNKISEWDEFMKMQPLRKLQKLCIKGNPLRNIVKSNNKQSEINLNPRTKKVLAGLRCDLEILSKEEQQMICEMEVLSMQILCFQNYTKKINVHMELERLIKVDKSTQTMQFSHFPKLKQYFQTHIYPNLSSMRSNIVKSLPLQSFYQTAILISYLEKEIRMMEDRKSQLVKLVYEREETRKNCRKVSLQKRKMTSLESRGQSKLKMQLQPSRDNTSLSKGAHKMHQPQPSRTKYEFTQSKRPRHDKYMQLSKCKENRANQSDSFTFQVTYPSQLIKLNPVFHLLHSPIASLKSKEKDLLLQSFVGVLKQKLKEIARWQSLGEQIRLERIQRQRSREVQQWELCMATQQLAEMNQNLQKLQISYLSAENKIHELQTINKSLSTQLSQRQILIQESNARDQQFTKLKSELQFQQQIEQIIKNKYMKNLKAKTLKLLKKKATNINKFKLTQQSIQQTLIENAFYSWKEQIVIQKKVKSLIQRKKHQNGVNFLQLIKESYQNQKNSKRLKHCLRVQHANKFFTQLFQNASAHKSLSLAINHHSKHLLSSHFRLISQNVAYIKQNKQFDISERQYCYWIVRRYWEKLKKSVSLRQSKQHQIQMMRKRSGLGSILFNWRQKYQIHIKSYGLQIFLDKYRRIFYYHMMRKSISASLFKRSLLTTRIITLKHHKYLSFFISTMRSTRLQHHIKRERQRQIDREIEGEIKERKKRQARMKRKKEGGFKEILGKYAVKLRFFVMKRSKLSLTIQNQIKCKQFRHVFGKLRTNLNYKKFFKNRKNLLSQYILNQRRKHLLPLISYRFTLKYRQKIMKLQKQKNEKLLQMRVFLTWRVCHLRDHLQILRVRLAQLGPKIEQIGTRQRETNEQKLLLLRQIEDRQDQIRVYEDRILKDEIKLKQYQQSIRTYESNLIEQQSKTRQYQRKMGEYDKKLYEYEYVLQSKQLKYEKLRDIYEQAVNSVTNSEDRPQRDYQVLKEEGTPQKYKYQYYKDDLSKTATMKDVFATFKRF